MVDPFELIIAFSETRSDVIRWACVLEATAPKPGNVFPGRSFEDLRHADFVQAADVAASCLDQPAQALSERIFGAVAQTRRQLGTNVNLGIVLLLAPLVVGEEMLEASGEGMSLERWQRATARSIAQLNRDEGGRIISAIQLAAPGGMGESPEMDVNKAANDPVDIVAAMRLARTRDRIALQYADGYVDLFRQVVPRVDGCIRKSSDLLSGIVAAHIELLSETSDTLIARKNGNEVADRVRHWASDVDLESSESIRNFDQRIRDERHRLNPGTTADLIAAALYVLLRQTNGCKTESPR